MSTEIKSRLDPFVFPVRVGHKGISEYNRPIPEIDEWLAEQGLISVKKSGLRFTTRRKPGKLNETPKK